MRALTAAIAIIYLSPTFGCQSAGGKELASGANLASAESATQENGRGLELADQGLFREAEQAFRRAIQLEGRYAAAHNNLGLTLLAQQRFYEAANGFRAANKLQPDAVEPLLNLAQLYETIGWSKEAAESLEQAKSLTLRTRADRQSLEQSHPTTRSQP